jgi:hypothetical protein
MATKRMDVRLPFDGDSGPRFTVVVTMVPGR